MTTKNDTTRHDGPVESAYSEFCDLWSLGKNPGAESFCTQHPECGPELLERIRNFLKVAEKFPAISQFSGERSEGAMDDLERSGKTMGDFRILRLISSGGMGRVYEAEQISLKRKVALKVLPHYLTFSDINIKKFHREAEAGSRQAHPGIVSTYAVGEFEGFHYIAMEYVEGGYNLADRLEEFQKYKHLPKDYFHDTATLIADVADALNHAHASRVIHRDVKPSNILITGEGKPKVTDFGLAKVEDALALSRTGDFAGTPYYMSPEQTLSGKTEIDRRTDIYSLGVTLYEALTFKRPFEGKTTQEILKKILVHDPRDPRKESALIPRDLSVICLKAMEKEPNHRYQSMADMAHDLRRYQGGQVILARPSGIVLRSWKRIKRNPVLSASLGVTLVAMLAFAVIVPWIILQMEMKNASALEEERNEANRQRNIAERQYEQVIRLSDLKLLTDLVEEEETLWPPYPENIPRLISWLTRVQELLNRLDDHRRTLEELRMFLLPYDAEAEQKDRETHPIRDTYLKMKSTYKELSSRLAAHDRQAEVSAGSPMKFMEDGVEFDYLVYLKQYVTWLEESIPEVEKSLSERRTWNFEEAEIAWQHEMLMKLASGLEKISDQENGLVRRMRERLSIAEKMEENSITNHQSGWDHAIHSIADQGMNPIYKGLRIKPQIGLVPVGQDAESRLWEFVHILTGEIPERDGKGKLEITEDSGVVLVLVPGGTFDMGAVQPTKKRPPGSPNIDPNALLQEGPVNSISLKPYFVSKYELTQAQWLRITGVNPSTHKPGAVYSRKPCTLLQPVEQVSWDDCENALWRMKLRLPTEAEWEYAARAGTTTVWWTGNERRTLDGAVNLADRSYEKLYNAADRNYELWLDDGYDISAPVDHYKPNPFGLHNVCGNVAEWCQDAWAHYSITPRDGSAHGTLGVTHRVIRGGSLGQSAFNCRSSFRFNEKPSSHHYYVGVRPACSLE